MSGAQKLLLVGGISLAVWGMAFGLWYAIFAEHQALEGMGGSLARGFAMASIDASGGLQQYRETKYVYDRNVDVHGHWIGLAMLLIVIGIGYDRVNFSEKLKLLLAGGLVLGSVVFPLGVLLQTFSHREFPSAVAIAGSALVVASLTGMVLGFARKGAEG